MKFLANIFGAWKSGWRVCDFLSTFYYKFFYNSNLLVKSPVCIEGSRNNYVLHDSVLINCFCYLSARGSAKIVIGKNVHISAHVSLITHGLEKIPSISGKRKHIIYGDIVLEDNVWLGAGAKVLGNVRVGKNSIVAAGAVVTSDIPKNSIAMGIPATFRPLR